MNKYLKTIIVCSFIALAATSCKEDDDKYATFDAPAWSINHNAGYYVTMTAVVKLPDNLSKYTSEDDQLAAFVGNECRGIGVAADGLWLVSLKGLPNDQAPVHFVYYGARNRYMYQTDELINFEVDKIYGTIDEPVVLSLKIIN